MHQGRESTEFTISSFSKLFCLKEVGEGLFFFICLTCDIRFKRISRVVEEGGGLDRERGKRRNSDTVLLLPPNRKRNCHHQSVGGGGGRGAGWIFSFPSPEFQRYLRGRSGKGPPSLPLNATGGQPFMSRIGTAAKRQNIWRKVQFILVCVQYFRNGWLSELEEYFFSSFLMNFRQVCGLWRISLIDAAIMNSN